jgi:hypothetical protein
MNTRPTPETDAETWKAGDLRIGSKVCADFARKLERERDKARIELEKYTTDSEDDALYNVRRLRKELTAMTAQRDRLAVALETAEEFMRHDLNCYARIGNADYKCHCGLNEAQFLAKQALQSLTHKP